MFWSSLTKQSFAQHKGQITKDGYFVIRNDQTRYQQLNLADALEKLRNLIRALERPTTTEVSAETVEKHRRKWVAPTREYILRLDLYLHLNSFCRHEKAARERLFVKRHRSSIKADRQNNSLDL